MFGKISTRSMALAASAVLLGSVGATVTATQAQAKAQDCPSRNVCVWYDGNYTGRMWPVTGYNSYSDVPSWLHDEGSSWANHNVNQRECIIDHVNGRKVYLDVLSPGTNRGSVPPGTNDRIDAVGWC